MHVTHKLWELPVIEEAALNAFYFKPQIPSAQQNSIFILSILVIASLTLVCKILVRSTSVAQFCCVFFFSIPTRQPFRFFLSHSLSALIFP